MYETIKKNRVLLSCVLGLAVFCFLLSRLSTPRSSESTQADTVWEPVQHAGSIATDEVETPTTTDDVPDENEPVEESVATEIDAPFMFFPGSSIESESAVNAPSITQNGNLDAPITIRNLPLDAPLTESVPPEAPAFEETKSVTDDDKKAPFPPWPPVVVQNVFPAAPMPSPQTGCANCTMPIPPPYPLMPMVPCRPVPVMRFVVVAPIVSGPPVIGAVVRPCRFEYRSNGLFIQPANRYATMVFVP